MKNKILFIIIAICVLTQFISVIIQNRQKFFQPGYGNQYESFKNAYSNSQYVKKKNPEIIPDEVLESFAGGIFLKGLNPIHIVHDHPPPGRYIVSLSIFLFDN